MRSHFLVTNMCSNKCVTVLFFFLSSNKVGQPARDVARHFVERWNYIKTIKSESRLNLPFLLPKGEYVSTRDESRFKGTCNVQLLRSSTYWSSGVEHEVLNLKSTFSLFLKGGF